LSGRERAVYETAEVNFYQLPSEKTGCSTNADCEADYFCLDYMWEYNSQFDSGKGCWHKSVCGGNGNASYMMFDERKLQMFGCSGTVTDALIYPIDIVAAKHWDTYEPGC